MIESENDVRAYVRQASSGRARWVEPALGSTPGLPDCWVPLDDGVVHLELKCGRMRMGMLSYEVRPEQRREIVAMARDNVPVGMLIGVKGTRLVIFARPTEETLSGRWALAGTSLTDAWRSFEVPMVGGFWGGVNFIFLKSGLSV